MPTERPNVPDQPTSAVDRPRLADGVELVGEAKGSGYRTAPWLVRRSDGTMIELSPLLYEVASDLDGTRDLAEVAGRVTGRIGRVIDAGGVGVLVDHKLRPLGLVHDPGAEPRRARSGPVLGLAVRVGVVPARVVAAASAVLAPLFTPVVVVAVLAGVALVDLRLGPEIVHGGASALFIQPSRFLAVVGLVLVGAAFHELGHAAASRYGGARPGTIGVGLYLLWPVFFNDVTDTYRLSRRGRIRADLGGVYFNAVFILLLGGLYGLSGFGPLLLVIGAEHLAIVQQFLPFVRLDGYYLVSDLAGVPDLFGRIRPVLASLVPGRPAPPAVRGLKPGARAAVTTWVLVTVPLLAVAVVLLGRSIPDLVRLGDQMARFDSRALAAAVRVGDVAGGVSAAVLLILVAVPAAGIAATTARVVRLTHGRTRMGGSAAWPGPARLTLAGAATVPALMRIPIAGAARAPRFPAARARHVQRRVGTPRRRSR